MGQAVIKAARDEDREFRICAGIDINSSTGQAYDDFPVYNSLCDFTGEADVIIDFSDHTSIEGILKFAVKENIPVVVATTGHTDEEISTINSASDKIAIFRSGNMSLGVNLLASLVKKAAAALSGFDIEIIEYHHNKKLDAPSGTALMLAEAAKEPFDDRLEYVYCRRDRHATRPENEIGIHSVRGGTIVGRHDVIFAGKDETVTLSHSAGSRDIFAHGALKAAAFIAGKKPGLYNMDNLVAELSDNI